MANTKVVEGEKRYTGGNAIEVTPNKVINLLLRAENNLLHVNDDNELYCDLQTANGVKPTDDFEVGVTTGTVQQADGRPQNGLLLHYEATSGGYAQWLCGADGNIYYDNGTGTFKQVYYSDEVDALIQELKNTKADKVIGATAGNLAGLDSTGNLIDSGIDAESVGDMQYEHFFFQEQEGPQIKLNDLSTTIASSTDFILLPPDEIKDGQIYILRIKNGDTVPQMLLSSFFYNPHGVSLTLTPNSIDMFTFLAVGGNLELQPRYSTDTVINNGTLTIQKNGQTVQTFSANQKNNAVANIVVPTDISQLTNDSAFITNTVNNLTHYYTKDNTYTKEEINDLVSGLAGFVVVDTLPSTGIVENKIYLLGPQGTSPNIYYEQYLYSNGAWVLLGNTTVDLSDYVTKDGLEEILEDYSTTEAMNTALTAINQSLEGALEGGLQSYRVPSIGDTISQEMLDHLDTGGTVALIDGNTPVNYYLIEKYNPTTGEIIAPSSVNSGEIKTNYVITWDPTSKIVNGAGTVNAAIYQFEPSGNGNEGDILVHESTGYGWQTPNFVKYSDYAIPTPSTPQTTLTIDGTQFSYDVITEPSTNMLYIESGNALMPGMLYTIQCQTYIHALSGGIMMGTGVNNPYKLDLSFGISKSLVVLRATSPATADIIDFKRDWQEDRSVNTASGQAPLIIWRGTVDQYKALGTKDPNTLYLVKDNP